MPTLADPSDLEDVPGLDLDGFDTGTILMALQLATSQIIGELGWDPIMSERTKRLRYTPYGQSIWLPAQNVTAVAVTADGADLTVEADWWDVDGRLDLDRTVVTSGLVTYTAGWFPGDETGPSEIPAGLRDACLALAAQIIKNPDRITSKTTGPFSYAYSDEIPGAYSLAPYRLLVVA
jgi:hypothetical protein